MVLSVYRKTYLLEYWSVRQSACLSAVVSPSIGIFNPLLNRPRVPGLFNKKKFQSNEPHYVLMQLIVCFPKLRL